MCFHDHLNGQWSTGKSGLADALEDMHAQLHKHFSSNEVDQMMKDNPTKLLEI
ncbi:hypothetical protein JCM19037_2257 [Geomicrobium sp. JCM 19037]|nr:hypothetical protein JCM19037_2257 [Geomicrobium sp. JCM 19037]